MSRKERGALSTAGEELRVYQQRPLGPLTALLESSLIARSVSSNGMGRGAVESEYATMAA